MRRLSWIIWVGPKYHPKYPYGERQGSIDTCRGENDVRKRQVEIHSSALAWRIPGTGEPGGLPLMGSQSRTRLTRVSSSSSRWRCEGADLENWSSSATRQGMLRPLKFERGKVQTLSCSFWKEYGLVNTLLLVQWNWFQTSGLQNCERINFCCFKSLSLW